MDHFLVGEIFKTIYKEIYVIREKYNFIPIYLSDISYILRILYFKILAHIRILNFYHLYIFIRIFSHISNAV